MGVQVKINSKFPEVGRRIMKQARLGLSDCMDDVVRTSSQSAPHDEGVLEKSWSKEIKNDVGTVSYTVKKRGGSGGKHGNFNYALKMHEGQYNLGAGSRAKRGGTGMSGKSYPVGTGYLSNVLKGEAETYTKHIGRMIKDAVKG